MKGKHRLNRIGNNSISIDFIGLDDLALLPVTQEVAGSNPVAPATSLVSGKC